MNEKSTKPARAAAIAPLLTYVAVRFLPLRQGTVGGSRTPRADRGPRPPPCVSPSSFSRSSLRTPQSSLRTRAPGARCSPPTGSTESRMRRASPRSLASSRFLLPRTLNSSAPMSRVLQIPVPLTAKKQTGRTPFPERFSLAKSSRAEPGELRVNNRAPSRCAAARSSATPYLPRSPKLQAPSSFGACLRGTSWALQTDRNPLSNAHGPKQIDGQLMDALRQCDAPSDWSLSISRDFEG
jgi:hypothetical protein